MQDCLQEQYRQNIKHLRTQRYSQKRNPERYQINRKFTKIYGCSINIPVRKNLAAEVKEWAL